MLVRIDYCNLGGSNVRVSQNKNIKNTFTFISKTDILVRNELCEMNTRVPFYDCCNWCSILKSLKNFKGVVLKKYNEKLIFI